jgi:hypothetical protein
LGDDLPGCVEDGLLGALLAPLAWFLFYHDQT